MSNQISIKKLKKDAKAISPLIATLLLIAIAVAASVITYSWVMSMIGSQSQQAQTAVRIDSLTWDVTNDDVTVKVRNTGSVAATIESVSIRTSATGSNFDTVTFTTSNSVGTGSTIDMQWSGTTLDILATTEYVVRVTTTTGFQYEMLATSPAS